MAAAPIDDDRSHGLLALDTVSSDALPIHGVSLSGGINALITTLYGSDGNATTPNPLNLSPFDYVSRSLAGDNVTETWTFKSGGSGGTTTNTIIIVYTDNTLATISTVTKT